LEEGALTDRPEVRRVDHGLLHGDSAFRINRAAAPGSYARTTLALEHDADVTSEFLQPGLGATLLYERADGTLDWQRAELRAAARRGWGALTLAAGVDAGVVGGARIPPQTLYEIGGGEGLPGYDYKEFAGNQATVTHATAMYTLPLFARPLRLWKRVYLPSPSPALSAGIHAGWTGASGRAARDAIAALGDVPDPRTGLPLRDPRTGEPPIVSRVSERMRASIDLSLRLFGGGVSVGMARAVDTRGPWVFVGTFGSQRVRPR
jgi:hypothetical protein